MTTIFNSPIVQIYKVNSYIELSLMDRSPLRRRPFLFLRKCLSDISDCFLGYNRNNPYFCEKLKTYESKYMRGVLIKRIWIWCRNLLIFLFVSSILAVVVYKFVPVYYTPLMFIRMYEQHQDGKKMKLDHTWVPISKIAQPLVQAVIASEDNLFMEHNGFDVEQIQKARAEAEKGKRVRGASTISQQTAKNVFLWPGKSYLRKGIEVYFTFLIEWIWGKERIMEVYLNSIEMGEGIYGAEAVAEAHFGKHAYQLTKSEAALIAATLPNPRKFNSAKPSPYMLKRQAKIISLMGKLIKVEMGYGAGQVDPGTGKVKKRKKWRASVIMTWDESLMPMR